jgi:hypothetical protein
MMSEEWITPSLIKHGEHVDEHWALFYQLLTQDTQTPTALSHTQTTWRIIPTDQLSSTREYESKIIRGTFLEFEQWVKGDVIDAADSSFLSLPPFSSHLVAVYADYKYFHELFRHTYPSRDSAPQIISDHQSLWLLPACAIAGITTATPTPTPTAVPTMLIDWALRGVVPAEMGPEAATFWLGSRGAHTPLHYGK